MDGLSFVNVYFGDETGYLRTDCDIGLAFDCGRIVVVEFAVGVLYRKYCKRGCGCLGSLLFASA